MTLLTDIREDFELSPQLEEDFKKAAEAVFSEENIGSEWEISLSFVTPEEIRSINKRFRKTDSVTDVLSFPASYSFAEGEKNEKGEIILGDVIICVKRAEEQALNFGHSFKRELVFLYVHSLLHLLGYDHMEDDEREIMENKQRIIMERLNILRTN